MTWRMAPRISPALAASVLAFVSALGGCTADHYVRQADRDVEAVLREGRASSVDGRRERAARPRLAEKPAQPLPEKVMEVAADGARPAQQAVAPSAPPASDALPPADDSVAPAADTSISTAQDPNAPAVAPAAATDPSQVDPKAPPVGGLPPADVRVLSLADALEIAVAQNRDYIARKEALYLSALSLTATRHAFDPLVAAALSYTFAGSDAGPEAHGGGVTMSLSQLLPTGARLGVSGSAGFSGSTDGSPDVYSVGASVRLTQPLLRGFGRDVAYEALTQAERNIIYAIRDFELFREGFSIGVAEQFYGIVQQKQAVDNQRRNYQGFVDGRKRAEALFGVVDSVKQLDVLRARRSELQSQNTLIEAEESLRLSIDVFRIFLGLPAGQRIDVADSAPEFVPVEWDIESAVEVARENRLDLLTRRQVLEDVRRGERIARDFLRPDLELSLGYDRAGGALSSFRDVEVNDDSYSASVTFGLPLDRLAERNSYRAAQIALDQARRGLDEFEDTLAVDVRRSFRELVRRKQSLEIQVELIHDQERNVEIAKMRFERGDVPNRDVVEAQEALLEALNTRIAEQVAYEIARLNLLRKLGILFIDEHGMWTE